MLECASELEMPPPSLVCWCARCAWFLSGMLIETEGVGNPTEEQKHHQHHHTNITTAASKSDIFKKKVLAQVEERIWSDAALPVTRRDARPVGRFCFQLDFHTWRRALGWRTLFFGLCCARALFLWGEKIVRTLGSAQVNWRCYPRPWFVGALGAPGSTLACLMPSEWDRPAEQKTSPPSESEVRAYPQQDAPPLSTPTSTATTTLLRMRLLGHSCSEPLSRKCFHHRDCLHDERSYRLHRC